MHCHARPHVQSCLLLLPTSAISASRQQYLSTYTLQATLLLHALSGIVHALVTSILKGLWRGAMQAYKAYKLGGRVSELLYSPALYGIDLSAQNMPKPRARACPMMTVVGNTLWLFGGAVEVKQRCLDAVCVMHVSHRGKCLVTLLACFGRGSLA